MQFNRHSGVHLVCIQMSVQIIAIANEPPSAILLKLLTDQCVIHEYVG